MEVKWDRVRDELRYDGRAICVRPRTGRDCTAQFGELAAVAVQGPVRDRDHLARLRRRRASRSPRRGAAAAQAARAPMTQTRALPDPAVSAPFSCRTSASFNIQVEADHVDHRLDKLRVVGELQRADLVRLELVFAPDPVRRGRRDPGRVRAPTDAPVRGAVRRRLERLPQHPPHLIVIDLPRPARPRRVSKPLQPPLTEVPTPQPQRRQRHPHLARDLGVTDALGRPEHDPGPQCLLLRCRRRPQHAPKHAFLLFGEFDRGSRARRHLTVL